MTSCVIRASHRYNPEVGLIDNVFGTSREGFYPFWCPNGFVTSMDQSSAILFVGSTVGAITWRKFPRLSAAALAGAAVFWVTYQAWSLEAAARWYKRGSGDALAAALSQGTFELLALAIIPFLLILFAPKLLSRAYARREVDNDRP